MKTLLHKRFLPKIILAGALVIGGGGWSSSSQAAPVTYGGDAEVVHVGLNLLAALLNTPINVDLVQVGPLPASGGFFEQHLLTIGDPAPVQLLLIADVASALTSGSGFESFSQASVAAAQIGLGPVTPTALAVTADVLQANAQASCVAPPSGGVALSGGSIVTNLVINGTPIVITGTPNQTITLPQLATIVINEQIKNSTATSGDVTVNALHITLLPPGSLLSSVLTGEVIISHAKASISNCAARPPCPDPNNPICVVCPDPTNPACPPVCPDPNNPECPTTCPDPNNPECPSCTVKDFITGGGQVTRNGKSVSFSTHGGINTDGTLRNGHLNVVDHGSGEHIQSTGFFSYFDPSPPSTKRTLGFNCTGASGTTCTVQEADNGEPGTADTWKVTTNGGYSAGSTSSPIARGNIQLHKPAGCSVTPTTSTGGGSGGPGKKPHK